MLRSLLRGPVHWWRRWRRYVADPEFRRQEREMERQYLDFRARCGTALGARLLADPGAAPRVLVAGIAAPGIVQAELALLKGLEAAGLAPVALVPRNPWIVRYYRLAGIPTLTWEDFVHPEDGGVEPLPDRIGTMEELLSVEREEVRVGRFAASTALRKLRTGTLDLTHPETRATIAEFLARSRAYARAARRIFERVRPRTVLFVDRGYTPQAELFDYVLRRGVPAVTWNLAHTSGALMLKRYSIENRDEHHSSLSAASWDRLRGSGWSDSLRERLRRELRTAYETGEWYGVVGTQFHKRIVAAEEIRARLGLDPSKKTAVIFPHILWDATFFWGRDLFSSYAEWYVETVRAACANPAVNWIIKVHPGHVVKNVRDGIRGEPAEIEILRRRGEPLPPHVFVLPADSDVNTYSLFSMIDYAVTVRGTIGIEAASFGIPVLTAGTGRYDRRGFTVDSDSREEYLARIARIQEIPPLPPTQRDLAERFAYGLFLARPMPLETVALRYRRDEKATLDVDIRASGAEDWRRAADLAAFARWIRDSREADFLVAPECGS